MLEMLSMHFALVSWEVVDFEEWLLSKVEIPEGFVMVLFLLVVLAVGSVLRIAILFLSDDEEFARVFDKQFVDFLFKFLESSHFDSVSLTRRPFDFPLLEHG